MMAIAMASHCSEFSKLVELPSTKFSIKEVAGRTWITKAPAADTLIDPKLYYREQERSAD
jgi:hypothetical protein